MAISSPPMDEEVNQIALETGTLEVTTNLIDIGSGSIFHGSAPNDMFDLQWITNTHRHWFAFLPNRYLWPPIDD
jgi:hypothetical protein